MRRSGLGKDIARHGHAEALVSGYDLAIDSILIEMMGLPATREIAAQFSVGSSEEFLPSIILIYFVTKLG